MEDNFKNNRERIKLIEEKALIKLKRLCPLTFPIMESLRTPSNDWVNDLKKRMNAYLECYQLVKLIIEDSLCEDVSDNIKKRIVKRCWEISRAFLLISLEYTKIINSMYKPLTMKAKKKIQQELDEYWKTLEESFGKSQIELKALWGKGKMASVWNDSSMEVYKKYIEKVLELSFADLKKNLEDGDTALGKTDDILDDNY